MGRASAPAPYASRRERVLAALDGGAIVLASAPVRYKSGDTEYRYRPSSELFYLTGFAEPDVVLVIAGHGDSPGTTVFSRPNDPSLELWTGARMGPEAAAEELGADEGLPIGELMSRLPELLEGARRVYARLGDDPGVDACLLEVLRRARARGARSGKGPTSVVDPGVLLDGLRLVKDPTEVDTLRRAADVTVKGFRRGLGVVAPGRGEWEVEAELERGFRTLGAFGPAFGTIVASGPSACVLHYTDNSARLADGDLVLIDAGAEVGFYAGDVTRTVPVNGRWTAAQARVYELVLEAQRAALAAVRPGVTLDAVHDAARDRLVAGLVELGVVGAAGAAEDPGAAEVVRRCIPHRTSHWLGLDVHDVGAYTVEGASTVLEPGMVFTVEPGLYLPEGVPGVPSELAGIGVRIEDDVLVTPEGHDNLTAALPTAAEEVTGLVEVGPDP